MRAKARPVIAISRCLLGDRVRYDAKSQGRADIYQYMQRHFDLLAICPEVEIGLGVPRPAVQLSGDPGQPRIVGRDDYSIDITAAMRSYCDTRPQTLKHIAGYIFKSRSPSCGLRDTPVYRQQQIIMHNSRGLFARAIIKQAVDMPVADENDLSNPNKRDHFMQQIYSYIARHADLF